MIISNKMDYADCGFYLMYRKNKQEEWKSFLNRPFLLNSSNDILVGQFISSNWFKILLKHDDNPDFIILGLPKRDNGIHPSVIITQEIIITRLIEAENNSYPYEFLAFVVLHKHYSIKDINEIRSKLIHDGSKGTNTTANMDDFVNITNNIMMGMRFDILETQQHEIDFDNLNDNNKYNTSELYVSCPRFELKLS
jgi:hypothetical protein